MSMAHCVPSFSYAVKAAAYLFAAFRELAAGTWADGGKLCARLSLGMFYLHNPNLTA